MEQIAQRDDDIGHFSFFPSFSLDGVQSTQEEEKEG